MNRGDVRSVPGYVYEVCRQLRLEHTTAKRVLWEVRRGGRLHGFRFRRQHPLGRYVADFYCSRARLVVEVDGTVHNMRAQQEYDRVRDEEIAARGLRCLRFTNADVFDRIEHVVSTISLELASPSPPVTRKHRPAPPTSPLAWAERGTGGEVPPQKAQAVRFLPQ